MRSALQMKNKHDLNIFCIFTWILVYLLLFFTSIVFVSDFFQEYHVVALHGIAELISPTHQLTGYSNATH